MRSDRGKIIKNVLAESQKLDLHYANNVDRILLSMLVEKFKTLLSKGVRDLGHICKTVLSYVGASAEFFELISHLITACCPLRHLHMQQSQNIGRTQRF